MARDPAFLFYPNDFDSRTQFFSDEQIGKYLRLLIAQFRHGHLSEKHMLHICKTYDKDIWDKFTTDDAGLFYNERLEYEQNKRKNFCDSRKNNRQKTESKEVKPKKHMKNISKRYDLHMENENENENRNVIAIKNELQYPFLSSEFMAVWNTLIKQPKWKKKSSEALQASLKQLSRLTEPEAIETMERSIAGGWQGLFPNKETQAKVAKKENVIDQMKRLHEKGII